MDSASNDLTGLTDANALPPETADRLFALGQQSAGDELPRVEVRYEIGREIGAGAMGSVVAVRHPAMRREVAMKLLAPQCDEAARLRFVAEVQITGQLEHPNIVPVHELATDEHGQTYYTKKLVHGSTVADVLARLARGEPEAIACYPLETLLTIFQKICDGVAFAHSRGVVHRDLKPANVMVGDYGEVVVMDWGVAKVLERAAVSAKTMPVSTMRAETIGAGETQSSSVVGTPHYMAPEQARGESEAVDERADIYSLGATLFHMLTLRHPVQGETARDVIDKVARGDIERLPMDGAIPESLAAVVRRAMALRREDRYASVLELQREISAYQHGFATEAERAGPWKHCALFLGRHKTASIVAAVGLGLVAAVSAGLVLNIIHERDRAEQAITSLQQTAPTLFDQSRALVENQRFSEALAKIDTAILILPRRPDFHAQRGNVLQALRRFDEATASYLQTLSLDARYPHAQENAELSGKLASLARKGEPLPQGALVELETSWRNQGRSGEVLSLGTELRASVEAQFPLWRAKIKAWIGSDPIFAIAKDGSIRLNISGVPVTDLEPLRGIPLTNLWMEFTQVRDLSPLTGMPLHELRVTESPVTDLSPLQGMSLKGLRLTRCKQVRDLSPLAGMPLTSLSIVGTAVTDLSPLAGAPLQFLYATSTRISDLSPLKGMKLEIVTFGGLESGISNIDVLRGMPLRSARFSGATALTDISALQDCRELEEVYLPPNAKRLDFLKRLPKLKRITHSGSGGRELQKSVEKFFSELERSQQPGSN